MKLLISYDDRVRQDSTAIYFKKAFENLLGKENVLHVYPENLFSKTYDSDLYVKIDDGLESNRWNPDFHPSLYYLIDTHIHYEWRHDLAEEGKFDYLFFAQKDGMQKQWHTLNKSWIPLGCDPDLHYTGLREKKYDVCFIGNFHSEHAVSRIDYIDRLFKEIPNFYFSSGNRFFLEMAKKLGESRLVFNKSLNNDVNMRFFEGLCSGSALLTDRINELSDLDFLESVHYIGYDSKEEMVDKAKFYLSNSVAREKISLAGKVLVDKEHTYMNRARRILNLVNKEKIEV